MDVTTETFQYTGMAGLVSYELTAITKGGITRYYQGGKQVKVELDENGVVTKVGISKVYNLSSESKKTSKETISYNDTGAFSDKGESYLPIKEFNDGSDTYQEKTNNLRDAVEKAANERETAAKEAEAKKQEAEVAAERANNAQIEAEKKEQEAKAAAEDAKQAQTEAAKKAEELVQAIEKAESAQKEAEVRKQQAQQAAKEAEEAEREAKEKEQEAKDAAKEAEEAERKAEEKEQRAKDAAEEAEKAAKNLNEKEQEAKKAEQEKQLADAKAQNAKTLADEIADNFEAAQDILCVAQENMNKTKDEWDTAIKGSKSAQEQLGAAKQDAENKETALIGAEKLEIMKKEAVSALEGVLTEAKRIAEQAAKKSEDAQSIKGVVANAYDKVAAAIDALSNLTAQKMENEEAYQKLLDDYAKALADYEFALAAKGVSEANLIRIRDAAQRARIAADAVFAYNTDPGTGTGGTGTGGGTGGGTGTGGGIGTGGGTGTEGGTGTGGGTGAGGGTGTEGGTGTGSGTGAGGAVMIPLGTGGGAGTAGIGGTAGTAAADADELRTVEDEDVPLADLNAGESAQHADSSEELQSIADEEVPLSDMKENQMKMSWWWWLLILVSGAAGTKMYIDHKRNLDKAEKRKR